MIHVDFRVRWKASNPGADTHLCRALMPQVPDVGELINVRGDPYIVTQRTWAVKWTEPDRCSTDGETYTTMILVPAGADQ